jgi:hypothetical protein
MKNIVAFVSVCGLAAPALAQEAPAAPAIPVVSAEPASQCELHVWPAEKFQAKTTGWGMGFGMLGAALDSAGHAKGDKARRSEMASALDSDGQAHALQQMNLVTLLNLPASRVVVHAEALDPKTVNKVLSRRSDSSAPCYNELIVTSVLYTKAAMWGRSLRTSFMLREFGNGSAAPLVKKTTGGNGLKIFPVKEGTDTTAADAELVSVFQRNFSEAAANFAKQNGRVAQ